MRAIQSHTRAAIRKALACGMSIRWVAKRFLVDTKTVSKIKKEAA